MMIFIGIAWIAWGVYEVMEAYDLDLTDFFMILFILVMAPIVKTIHAIEWWLDNRPESPEAKAKREQAEDDV